MADAPVPMDDPGLEANEWHDQTGRGGVAVMKGDVALIWVTMQPDAMDDLARRLIRTAQTNRMRRTANTASLTRGDTDG